MLQSAMNTSVAPGHPQPGVVAPCTPATDVMLSDLEFIVLSLLEQEPMYGLEILYAVQQLQSQLNGKLRFSPGQLHPILQTLGEAGLVVKSQRNAPYGHTLRTYYSLSRAGLAVLSNA